MTPRELTPSFSPKTSKTILKIKFYSKITINNRICSLGIKGKEEEEKKIHRKKKTPMHKKKRPQKRKSNRVRKIAGSIKTKVRICQILIKRFKHRAIEQLKKVEGLKGNKKKINLGINNLSQTKKAIVIG
jgi:hypothetical protein